jgi:pimeloyl-ACP methyl ester carboxylesterase
MKRLKKISIWLFCALVVLYIILCAGMYFLQESLIFHPKKLEANYKYRFEQKFEELNIPVSDNKKINGLLLKCDSAKGLIFYLHGNAGTLDTWGEIGKHYVPMHYDVFVMDYRGFGKSEGEIYSEEQFYSDAQTVYDELKKRYKENSIVIIGYSIGTGSASMLASKNNPKMLVLQAPYYSLIDMMHHTYPFVPNFLLKYKFETFRFLEKVKAPVLIFHGDADEIIYYGSSLKLKEHFKPGDRLITLPGAGHLGMNHNETYLEELNKVLNP